MDLFKLSLLLILSIAAECDESSSKTLSTELGNQFVKAMNSKRAKAPGGAKNMGCLTWSASLAEEAKKVAENCSYSLSDSTYGYLKSTWRGEFKQYLTVPTIWATLNQNFDVETMKCKVSGWCDDFLQSTYYKRGKIGCAYNTKCGLPDYLFVCAFENKIPKDAVPYEKGTYCSSCAQNEKCTAEKCCSLAEKEDDHKKDDKDKKDDNDKKDDKDKKDDNDKKDDKDKDDPSKVSLTKLYRFVNKKRGNVILKTKPDEEKNEVSLGLFGYVASSSKPTSSCNNLDALWEWKKDGKNRMYTLSEKKPRPGYKNGEIIGYVASQQTVCGADTPVYHYVMRWKGQKVNLYTKDKNEIKLTGRKTTYVGPAFYMWKEGTIS